MKRIILGSALPPPFDRAAVTAERWKQWRKQGYNPCATKTARRNMSRAQKLSWTRRPRVQALPIVPSE